MKNMIRDEAPTPLEALRPVKECALQGFTPPLHPAVAVPPPKGASGAAQRKHCEI